MKIITRKEAQALGLKRYFTGEPCNRGHIAERQTSDGSCCECKQLHKREFNQSEAGKEANRLHQRNYEKTEKGKQARRRKYEKNPHKTAHAFIRRNTPSAIIPLTAEELTQAENKYRFAAELTKRSSHAWHVDHCYPLSRGGVHHPDNLQILTASQNLAKSNKLDPSSYSQWKGLMVSIGRSNARPRRRADALLIHQQSNKEVN